jgi:type I restriction enzyme M protein
METLIANFIWGIADDVLRDVYVRGKYRDVILPMTVIRRLDAVLEPTKDAVLKIKERLDQAGVAEQHLALCQAAGEAFYNASKFTLRDLKARAKHQQLKADFEAYLDGFSSNVQQILDKFKFRNQIPTLVEANILGSLIEKFLDSSINLSPKPVLNGDGEVRLPGLDNYGMGTIFEELTRRFNEENNEEAGEHFTPRDVVKLMADLIFLPINEQPPQHPEAAGYEMPVDVKTAARFLGVSPSLVYAYVERKQIPHFRMMGRSIRFSLSELEKWRRQFFVNGGIDE